MRLGAPRRMRYCLQVRELRLTFGYRALAPGPQVRPCRTHSSPALRATNFVQLVAVSDEVLYLYKFDWI